MSVRLQRLVRRASFVARAGAGVIALRRLARGATAAPPVRPTSTPSRSISVVIPARDEADRIGPLLATIVGAPGLGEVLVVDDESSDDTAGVAAAAGASVLTGLPLPEGWAGKAWALQQGVEAATGDWIVMLDADTHPDPRLPTALVARALGEQFDLVSVAGRFDCPSPSGRWLHAAMLTTLVTRFGPPGTTRPDRMLANGQCMAADRQVFVGHGGFEPVRDSVVEDVAIARHLTVAGRSVGFLDGCELLTVRMFDTVGQTWHGWGRSLALPGVEPRRRQLLDLAVIVLAQALPLPRVLTGRGDAVDKALAIARVGTLVGTRRAFTKHDAAYWTSPLADLPAALAIALGIRRGRTQTWRGRTYS